MITIDPTDEPILRDVWSIEIDHFSTVRIFCHGHEYKVDDVDQFDLSKYSREIVEGPHIHYFYARGVVAIEYDTGTVRIRD